MSAVGPAVRGRDLLGLLWNFQGHLKVTFEKVAGLQGRPEEDNFTRVSHLQVKLPAVRCEMTRPVNPRTLRTAQCHHRQRWFMYIQAPTLFTVNTENIPSFLVTLALAILPFYFLRCKRPCRVGTAWASPSLCVVLGAVPGHILGDRAMRLPPWGTQLSGAGRGESFLTQALTGAAGLQNLPLHLQAAPPCSPWRT